MRDDRIDGPGPDANANADADAAAGPDGASRRRLMLGAAAASMVVTIRPALAQTATSVLTCQIPIPNPRQRGKWVAQDGTLVAPFTPRAVRPPDRPVKGEDVRKALQNNTPLPGTTREQTSAYVRYMQRLQNGNSGFTCFVSLKTR